MPLLNTIKADETLAPFLSDECCENNICAEVEEGLSIEDYLVIKVDDYYNSLGLAHTPPSPDCLFVIRCDDDDGYKLAIVELKKTTRSKQVKVANIIAKFETCFDDFMLQKFSEYFDRDFNKIELFFVSRLSGHSQKLKSFLRNPIKFGEKTYLIDPRSPSPMITPCN